MSINIIIIVSVLLICGYKKYLYLLSVSIHLQYSLAIHYELFADTGFFLYSYYHPLMISPINMRSEVFVYIF